MSKLLERLQDASRSGVYRTRRTDELRDATRDAELDVVTIRLPADASALPAIAAALAFPAWFGGNWDALEDCLSDLSWRPGQGHVLVFEGMARGEEHGILVDVLRSCAEFWAGEERPFFAVFVDPQRELALPDLFRES